MSSDGCVMYVHRMGIDTYKHPIVFARRDCEICRSEGFEAMARVHTAIGNNFVIATLNTVAPDLLEQNHIGLSEFAWNLLGAKEGDVIKLSHPAQLDSLSYVRSKVYGNEILPDQMYAIIKDIAGGHYSDVELSSFVTACSGNNLNDEEIYGLTQAMINVGDKISWPFPQVVDKHCVGGIPGNRTTMLVVPIVAAYGLVIPKTSSRAITSPAGTADTMEVLAPVELSLAEMRRVVEKEHGCIVWGGAAHLSPADDILIGIERALNLDNEGQLVASVLSKKLSAGSTHVVIDVPIGPTAKVRSQQSAKRLRHQFLYVAKAIGIKAEVVFSDGSKPIGYGIGPALEARDILAVLQNKKEAPKDLRDRALFLAGKVLELSREVAVGKGLKLATEILTSGKAWQKFQAICRAQGGLFEPKYAKYRRTIEAPCKGTVTAIDNRRLATIAKLAGAPRAKSAGMELHANVGTKVDAGQPLFTVHAESPGELEYAIAAIRSQHDVMRVECH